MLESNNHQALLLPRLRLPLASLGSCCRAPRILRNRLPLTLDWRSSLTDYLKRHGQACDLHLLDRKASHASRKYLKHTAQLVCLEGSRKPHPLSARDIYSDYLIGSISQTAVERPRINHDGRLHRCRKGKLLTSLPRTQKSHVN